MIASELLPERNCAKCTATQKLQWGCEGNAKLPLIVEGEELKTCPRRPILDNPAFFGEFFRLYRGYQKGLLPEEGALLSQPSLLMECFTITDLTLDMCNAHRREAEAKKAARGRRAKSQRP